MEREGVIKTKIENGEKLYSITRKGKLKCQISRLSN